MAQTAAFCPDCFAGDFGDTGKCPKCGYQAVSLGESSIMLRPGTLLGQRYLLGRVLGMGGFGVTYLAMDKTCGRKCAVKEYLPTQIAVRDAGGFVVPVSKGDGEIYARGLELFGQEAQMLSGFLGNESVVQVWGFFQQNGTAYFVMEYLDGVTLKALCRSMNGKIPLEFARAIFRSTGGALEQLHQKGLLHRDVSPENIMITRQGAFKLIDFGATRFFVGEQSKSLSVVLKPGFAPPEQYSSRGKQGPWVDVYALASTFYMAVSGKPMPDATDRLAGVGYTPLCELEPQISKDSSRVLDRALELNYKNRYTDMHSFIVRLFPREISAGQKPPAAIPPPRAVQSHLKSTPVLRDLRSAAGKWILPQNMDMVLGCSAGHCNIVLRIAGGAHIHAVLRFDAGKGCFYIWNIQPAGLYLADGTPLKQKQVYTLQNGERFFLISRENMFQVGVE